LFKQEQALEAEKVAALDYSKMEAVGVEREDREE